MNLRGRYEGGGYIVTAKHWWSPRARKSARLAALLMEHEAPRIDAAVRERIKNYLLYGEDRLP